jgi:transcriptional regulator with XRE-family HTH domain
MAKKIPNKDDAAVGARVRSLRISRGMSQEKLADLIGLTFQQVQKYEKGTNRIGGSRMIQIAHALKVPVATLFGENGRHGPTIDPRLDNRVRQRLVDLLVKARDQHFETALADLVEAHLKATQKI